MIRASPWPGWIRPKQDLLSRESGCLFYQLFVSSLTCWPPPFPSITYFGSEKQLPPITCTNSIRQELVLKVFIPSASGVYTVVLFWKTLWGRCDVHLPGFWSLVNLMTFKSNNFSPSHPLPCPPFPCLSPSLSFVTQNGGDCTDQN